MRSSRPSMRAWCQHCDATETIAPEEIYSPEFNFWCPRCQSILILQDETGSFALNQDVATPNYGDAITKVDREDEVDARQAPTKEDDEEPPVDTTIGEPEAGDVEVEALRRRTVSLDALDAYSALAAELDA